VARFEIAGPRTVRDTDGREYDVLQAIAALPWVRQLCPLMSHEYAAMYKSDRTAFDVAATMVSSRNPGTYLAYFRGYRTPNRYWTHPTASATGALASSTAANPTASSRYAARTRERPPSRIGTAHAGRQRHRPLPGGREGTLVADAGGPCGWFQSVQVMPAPPQEPRRGDAVSGSPLGRSADVLGFGQTRCEDPHELRGRRSPPPWTGHSPGGASRLSATGRVGARLPSPSRRREPRRPPRPHALSRFRPGGGLVDASCAADQLDGRRRLCEAHGDRKVVGGGAIPVRPPTDAIG